MARKFFDSKFGVNFIAALPTTAGVYRVFNSTGELIYVGKAINLRRRLSQYRNASRLKVHRKMKAIMKAAFRIEIESVKTDADAQKLELKLIQTFRPQLNVVFAYSFMYPLIGIRRDSNKGVSFLLTTRPESFSNYKFHGCFRSRTRTRDAFWALSRLLNFVGNPKFFKLPRTLYSTRFDMKALEKRWEEQLHCFFEGTSANLLSELCLALVEKSGARNRREQIQKDIEALEKFWRTESSLLNKVRMRSKYLEYPVAQSDRDPLFLNDRLSSSPTL